MMFDMHSTKWEWPKTSATRQRQGGALRYAACLMMLPLLAVWGTPRVAEAQFGRAPKSRQAQGGEAVRGKGELVAAQPGLLQVKDDKGVVWLLQVRAQPEKIIVDGTADASWLAPGMIVRFSAELTAKGEVVAPVDKMTVFTPRPNYLVGIVPEAALQTNRIRFGEETPAAQTSTRYLVAGRITKRGDATIVVTDGRQKVTAQLAEQAEIQVDILGDYRMIRPGDKVQFKGRMFQPGRAVISELKVTGATPFGNAQAKPTNDQPDRGNRNVSPSQ